MRVCLISLVVLLAAVPFSCYAVPQATHPRFVLEDGTPVKLVLAETISSSSEHKGNLVLFSVAEDVSLGDVVVIPKGAYAWGTIIAVKTKRKMGRGGRLEVAIDKVRLADGEKAPLTETEGGDGDSHETQMATGIAVTGALAWPAAPLFLLMHGKDITMRKGAETMAFVAGDDPLEPAKFTPEALAAANNLAPPPASVAPTSSTSSALGSAPNTAPTGPEDAGPVPAPNASPNDPGGQPRQ
ncbi:MAG: hypothetical protein WBF06_07190 [Candidatus Acidiferrales bacterium]